MFVCLCVCVHKREREIEMGGWFMVGGGERGGRGEVRLSGSLSGVCARERKIERKKEKRGFGEGQERERRERERGMCV